MNRETTLTETSNRLSIYLGQSDEAGFGNERFLLKEKRRYLLSQPLCGKGMTYGLPER